MAGGLDRAQADLAAGNHRRARERLKGLLVAYPHDIRIRTLLADAYRRDRQFAEAGRWGYLCGPAATERERQAFERHCAFGWRKRITRARLRHLLRCSSLEAIADEFGLEQLRQLPDKRRPHTNEGLIRALLRWLAVRRAAIVTRR